MKNLPVEQWAGAVRLAIRQEDMYAKNDGLDPLLEPEEPTTIEENINDNDEPEEPEEPEKEILKCSNCDYVSETPHFFKQHTNSIIECSECSKVFCGKHAKREHKSHQKKQHEVKQKIPFMCVHCNKQYPIKSKLKHHMIWSKCGRKTPPKE